MGLRPTGLQLNKCVIANFSTIEISRANMSQVWQEMVTKNPFFENKKNKTCIYQGVRSTNGLGTYFRTYNVARIELKSSPLGCFGIGQFLSFFIHLETSLTGIRNR
jgi:hypothetical protein